MRRTPSKSAVPPCAPSCSSLSISLHRGKAQSPGAGLTSGCAVRGRCRPPVPGRGAVGVESFVGSLPVPIYFHYLAHTRTPKRLPNHGGTFTITFGLLRLVLRFGHFSPSLRVSLSRVPLSRWARFDKAGYPNSPLSGSAKWVGPIDTVPIPSAAC